MRGFYQFSLPWTEFCLHFSYTVKCLFLCFKSIIATLWSVHHGTQVVSTNRPTNFPLSRKNETDLTKELRFMLFSYSKNKTAHGFREGRHLLRVEYVRRLEVINII